MCDEQKRKGQITSTLKKTHKLEYKGLGWLWGTTGEIKTDCTVHKMTLLNKR